MATKFVLVPQEIYRGLTTVSDTGDINLDTVRHDLNRARSERTNPTAKNVRYNQQLRRYLHMRNEHESKPTKVELSKGLSVLVKHGGEEEAEVVDTPQPHTQVQSRIAQTQQTRRPEPSNNRLQSRKRKATNSRAHDPTGLKRNLLTADREAIQRFQWQIGRRRALKQPTRYPQQRDLVAEAAAAPLDDDDDDDDYFLENGNTLPAPPILHGDLPDDADENNRPNFVLMDSSNEKEAGGDHQRNINNSGTPFSTAKMEIVLDSLYNNPSSPAAFAGHQIFARRRQRLIGHTIESLRANVNSVFAKTITALDKEEVITAPKVVCSIRACSRRFA
uniref:Uncharacterized protein n=1 Tax=Globodera rostochiensis TaxID=31243 RepID=A0A914HM76_GLORO